MPPLHSSSGPAALRELSFQALLAPPDSLTEDAEAQRPLPVSAAMPVGAGPRTPDPWQSAASPRAFPPTPGLAGGWGSLPQEHGPFPLFPAGSGQSPVHNMLPIDWRSLGPGLIDGHRELGRRVMRCQLFGGGVAGPGL